MNTKALSILFIFLAVQAAPALASDWVEDEEVEGFYSRGVQRNTPQPQGGDFAPQGSPVPQRSRMAVPQSSVPSEFDDPEFSQGNMMNGVDPYPNINRRPAPNQGFQPTAQKKSVFGKAKSLGKSIVKMPGDFFAGTGDMLDSPGFWQGAGALAGTGANAYMNYRYMKNNPYYNSLNPYGVYNPYNPLNPYGSSPYLGGGYYPTGRISPLGSLLNPLGGYNPMGGYGAYNPLGGYGYNPYGTLNPYNSFGSPMYGSYNPYGYGVPYGSVNPLPTAFSSLNPLLSPFGRVSPTGPVNPLSTYGSSWGLPSPFTSASPLPIK